MKYIASIAVLAAGCARSASPSAVSPIAHHVPPTPVPAGWRPLHGPLADPLAHCPPDETGCTVTDRRAIAGGGIIGIARLTRGLGSALAVETPVGWFIAPLPPHGLENGHHEPRSAWVDLDQTRIEDGALVVRTVDDWRTFYPGQGAAGVERTVWSEQTCRVLDAVVFCSSEVTIASERCATDEIPGTVGTFGPEYERTCTGGAPPPASPGRRAPARAAL